MPQNNTTTNWKDATPGWTSMGEGLSADFLDGEPTLILTTVAMLCMQPVPRLVEPHPQSIASLALYAAGCAVSLDTQQFRKLERTVVAYLDYVAREERFAGTRNWDYVNYVRERALERARHDGII